MKKIIELVDKDRNIFRVTTPEDRWYTKTVMDGNGLPVYHYVPSVTWITHFYHKGEELLRYYGRNGYDEAQQLKKEAGDKGTRVHMAIADTLSGKEVKAEDKYTTRNSDIPEELTVDEWTCVHWFYEWFKEAKPEILASEFLVWNEEYNYAGTVDFLCKIGDEYWMIDFKTGQYLAPTYELQLAAYKHAVPSDPDIAALMAGKDFKLAVLQVNYKYNKIKKYKFTEVQDDFKTFLALREIWQKETKDQVPLTRELPLSIKINLPDAEGEDTEVKPDNK